MAFDMGESGNGNTSGDSDGSGAGAGGSDGSGGGGSGPGGGDSSGGDGGGGGDGDYASFVASLPDEIKASPSLKTVSNLQDLAKSFVHAQSMVGKEKIVIPGQNASEQEWNAVWQKLGHPDAVEGYDVTMPKSDKESLVDQELFDSFKAKAHEAKILPKQAQTMIDWFNERSAGLVESANTQSQAQQVAEIDALKKEWGENFGDKVQRANMALKEFADEPLMEQMEKTGLFKNTAFLKLMASVSDNLNEATFRNDSVSHIGKSSEEIRSEIDSIMGNPKHAYHNAEDPAHKAEVARVSKLFTQISA